MVTLRRTSTDSQSSLETLISHREQQVSEPTDKKALIPKELPPLPHLEGKSAYPPTAPKDHITRNLVSPDNTASESITYIVAGSVAGVAITISHHIFLAYMDGRNIDEYPQYWVKNANNAFSALFSICIAFVATCALIQMARTHKWNTARSKPLSIRSIDNLFALPSPAALLTTVTSTRLRSLRTFLIPIITAIFIQSLALVSVFAPNALTVARSAEMSRDILVPTLDLSRIPFEVIKNTVTSHVLSGPSPIWLTTLFSIMAQPPLLDWKIPPGCGATCKFDLVYEGPGLQCMDTPSEPPPYTGEGEMTRVYNGTSTFNSTLFANTSHPEELRIIYIATNDQGVNIGRDGGSVYCVFRNATYKASFQAENNTMEVNYRIQSYGGILTHSRYTSECPVDSYRDISPCHLNYANTGVMCEVFASALMGQIQASLSSLTHPAETTGGINGALIDLLFSHSSSDITRDFHLAVSNLSEGVVGLFSDLTLAAIPHQNATTTVRAKVWDGSYAWKYTVWILWAVYLPTLLLASLVIINGLLSIQSNNRGMYTKFSNFLLTTRSAELDEVCIDAADFEEFQQLRLLYRREKGTFSVVSVPSEGVEEM